jgi:RNA polymerase sigma-70 factor, ECF subfamily
VNPASRVDDLEVHIRRFCTERDWSEAAAAVLRGYGHEIFGYLMALHRNHDEAGEVFSTFSEHLLRGISGFAWQCSCRAWAYTLARNASFRFRRSASRRAKRFVPLSDCGPVSEIANRIRTETSSYLQTDKVSKARALREMLSEEDQTLLILRVDRQLRWNELAQVMLGEESATPEELKRTSARLRKRYQLVKEKLLERMRSEAADSERR